MEQRREAEQDPVDCRKVNLANKVDLCSPESLDVAVCYHQCMTAKELRAQTDVCRNANTYKVGCIATNCVTVHSPKEGDQESANVFLAETELFRSVQHYCTEENAVKLMDKLNKALDAGKNFRACCGVNKLGALIGGTIAGVVVVVAVAVLLWMILAKKACFSGRNGAKASSHGVQDIDHQQVVVVSK